VRVRDRYDAVVIGAGPAGEALVERLLQQGRHVALVERELVGGECAYWACIPSKTLLRATEARAAAQRVAGLERPALRWRELARYRDYMIRGLDDSEQVEEYRRKGVDLYKGEATIASLDTVGVGENELHTDRIVIATGSDPVIPEIAGLSSNRFWTTREATTVSELPASLTIVGGGPVGVELAQFYARVGTTVTLVASDERLLSGEEPRMSELIADVLREEGVDVRLGARVASIASDGSARIVRFADRGRVRSSQLVIAAGRKPRVPQSAIEVIGIALEPGRLPIDARCRVAKGVWAIGDVTGVMPFTHVAKYQARVVARDIAGERIAARYDAIPRVTFTDPELAAVGLTEQQAREREIDVAVACVDLPATIARPSTYEREPRGVLGLVTDRQREVLVGAWSAAPLAAEWIHQAALAIRARVPVRVLRDTVAQFPTFSESYVAALEALDPFRRRSRKRRTAERSSGDAAEREPLAGLETGGSDL
jgi:pyruvate/2-oxoglutarate dehydrogenase complex dihydrolipoamide dehydrogenase (E3) component